MLINFILIFIFSFFARMIFVVYFPETGGDYDIYATIAANILQGCGVSLSAPSSGECLPHFGGNHGPGYPFFMAFIWRLFEESDNVIRVIQTLIYSSFNIYLLLAIKSHVENKKFLISFGLVLAFSPLLIAWPRYVQTETLSIAFTLFLIAEILISFKEKKVRIIQIALALTLATWIRLDNIFLTIPVAVCCFYLHGIKKGFLKGFIIASYLSLSWGLWTVRNIIVELPSIIPTNMIMPDGSRSPTGYLSWTKTWMTHEYEKPGALWGINRKNYANILIPDYAYFDENEKKIIKQLIFQLKNVDGQPFPEEIDIQFEAVADFKRQTYPIKYWVINPLNRIYKMWTNPYSSFGWPNEIPSGGLSHNERLLAAKGNIHILFLKVKEYPLRSISKGVNAFYKYTLFFLFIFSLLFILVRKKSRFINFFSLISISYLLGKTIFYSINGSFETRYISNIIPFMELLVALFFYEIFNEKLKSSSYSKSLPDN